MSEPPILPQTLQQYNERETELSELNGYCQRYMCHYLDDDNHFCEAKYTNLITDIIQKIQGVTIDTGYGVQFPPADRGCVNKLMLLQKLSSEFRDYVKRYDLMVKKSRDLDEYGYPNET